MTMDAQTCADPALARAGTSKVLKLTHKTVGALRYDDLSRVLLGLQSRTQAPSGPRRERKARTDKDELNELRACVAALQSENERILDRIAGDLDAFADRLVALEAEIRQPLWRRIFGRPAPQPELAERTRRKLLGQLRAAFLEREEPERRAA
jgi:hypothetical protein